MTQVRDSGGKIQNAMAKRNESMLEAKSKETVGALLNDILDKDKYRKRFDELLGKRAPQFISSIVSLCNADDNLKTAMFESPATVIQAALKAATFDLPIDPSLGYAYIVPFNNGKTGKKEAQFIMGYKGMIQLALRTGVYKTINVTDVREGELKSFNRLTEEIDIEFVEDEVERDKLPIIGWCGFFKLINGTEKTVYMSKSQIDAHEQKNRKGSYMGKGWKENYNAMAEKTVLRRLIGKWGIMSIDYQKANPATLAAADAIAAGKFDDEDNAPEFSGEVVDAEFTVADPETGEIEEDFGEDVPEALA